MTWGLGPSKGATVKLPFTVTVGVLKVSPFLGLAMTIFGGAVELAGADGASSAPPSATNTAKVAIALA